MKNLLKFIAALACCLTFSAPAFAASHLSDPIPSSVIVSAGGMEWVWAGPCSPIEPSCGVVEMRDGFTIPTEAQWLSSFANTAAVVSAFTTPNGGQVCASPWFNVAYDHCDSGDLSIGAIWHAPSPIGQVYTNDPAAEAFLVRAVPEPETYAMLVAGLGLLGFIGRRRKAA